MTDFAVLAAPEGRSFVSVWWPVFAVVPMVIVGLGVYWFFFAEPAGEDHDDFGEEVEEDDDDVGSDVDEAW